MAELEGQPTGRRTVRVLHIEDSATDAAIVRRLLASQGYVRFVVDTATTAATAEELLRRSRYDLIFLDNGLPDESGLSLLRRLGTMGAPVIVLTAQRELEQEALSAGAAGFLSKDDLDSRQLTRAIVAVLGPLPGTDA